MAILTKLFNTNKIRLPTCRKPPPSSTPPADNRPMPLRIVHAGGSVECYYMAVPASAIMEKHQKCVLARPDVFHRPWQPLVRPEDILTPGDKYYVVPRGTLRKLRKRMRRPSSESESDLSLESLRLDDREMRTDAKKSVAKVGALQKKKVRFVEPWHPSLLSIDESSPVMELQPPYQETQKQRNNR